MSTRSTIWIQREDGLEGVYSHWDGYVSHNGKILYENYNTPEKVQELINGGHLSSLEKTPEETKFYNDGTKNYFANTVKDTKGFEEEYNYIFIDDSWFYYTTWGINEPKPIEPSLI